MEAGRQEERDELWANARLALHDPLRHGHGVPAPSSGAVQCTLWIEHGIDPARSWSVINAHSGRTGAHRLFARRITWNSLGDRRRLSDPMTGLREGFHTTPTIEVSDVDLDEAQWKIRRADLEGLSLGPLGWGDTPRRIMTGAHHYGLDLLVPVHLSLQWHGVPPEGWSAVVTWVRDTIEWLDDPRH